MPNAGVVFYLFIFLSEYAFTQKSWTAGTHEKLKCRSENSNPGPLGYEAAMPATKSSEVSNGIWKVWSKGLWAECGLLGGNYFSSKIYSSLRNVFIVGKALTEFGLLATPPVTFTQNSLTASLSFSTLSLPLSWSFLSPINVSSPASSQMLTTLRSNVVPLL